MLPCTAHRTSTVFSYAFCWQEGHLHHFLPIPKVLDNWCCRGRGFCCLNRAATLKWRGRTGLGGTDHTKASSLEALAALRMSGPRSSSEFYSTSTIIV